jgi:1-acyl-sn-glycerol-3-phosphate acyltransferase
VLAVSNNVSWVDIVVYGSLMQPAFVSKAEVAKWPVVGAIARATNTIFLPRGAFKTHQTSDTLAATLNAGTPVMLFPEATTSDSATPARFHARLFAAALDHDYPVQPVAIRYLPEDYPENLPEQAGITGQHPWAPWINDAGLGGHLNKLLRLQKLNVSVSFCEAISPQGYDRRSLAQASHSSITAQLQP